MSNNPPTLRQTDDGSNTLFDADSGECFHSHKGALTESLHVFIEAGDLRHKMQQAVDAQRDLNVVEMGLGTGLNYLLSAQLALETGCQLHYHALELTPVAADTLVQLDYAALLNQPQLLQEFSDIVEQCQRRDQGCHRWDTRAGSLTIELGDALRTGLPDQSFDLCYFDAFSPTSAPEMWQREQLQKFHDALQIGGVWVSYCARGAVRRDLIACGFAVERLPGPPGKREMLRATRR
ncbi:MAG: tRNA (5-methylaminomethyl-2-thiouridine)(34)-methyltransferase MnmD [Granulosicoccaceae bacterium]